MQRCVHRHEMDAALQEGVPDPISRPRRTDCSCGLCASRSTLLRSGHSAQRTEATALPDDGPALLVCGREFHLTAVQFLIRALSGVRAELRVLAPALPTADAALTELCIVVSAKAKRAAAAQNYRPLQQAVSWLAGGGVLLAFPAGEASNRTDDSMLSNGPRWSDTSARLAMLTGAPVVPVVPFEDPSGSPAVRLGPLISAATLEEMPTLRDATEYIRVRTERIDPMRPNRDRLVPRLAAS